MSRRLLLLSADFGSGHLAAAKAIAALWRARGPDCEAEVVQVESPALQLASRAYLWLIDQIPSLYRRLYQMEPGRPQRALLRLILGRTVRQLIDRFQPDIIVGTHPFPAGVAAHLRHMGRLKAPVVMALTDFLPHGFWICDGVDHYCVPSETARARLIQMGVNPGRVTVTGVAIRPEFAEASRRTRRGPDGLRRVLVMGGGLGLGPIRDAVASLAALPNPDLYIRVICGRNRPLQEELTHRFGADPRIEVVGFTTRVEEYMAESDLLVTKPGGITCSEALALRLPMLLLSPLPGHEEENAAYLVGTGAALVAAAHEVGRRAADLLFARPEKLEAMRQRAAEAGHPHSAAAIVQTLVNLSTPKAGRRHTVG